MGRVYFTLLLHYNGVDTHVMKERNVPQRPLGKSVIDEMVLYTLFQGQGTCLVHTKDRCHMASCTLLSKTWGMFDTHLGHMTFSIHISGTGCLVCAFDMPFLSYFFFLKFGTC